mgnify:CR=1 FL=1
MKKFSNEFRPALREIRKLNAIVSYHDPKGFYILTTEDDDNLLTENGFEIATESGVIDYDKETINSVNPLFNASLFKTTCKSIQIECKNKIPIGTYLKVEIGVYKPNEDKYEYLDYGDYLVNEEPVYQADSNDYLVTGYDKMIESMISYDDNPLSITFPIKHKDFVIAICDKFNWKYNLIDYPNANKNIAQDFYKGQNLTYRDVLDDLNGVCGGSFMFDLNNNLIWKRPAETNEIVEDDDLKDVNVDFSEKYGKVNALTITTNGNAVLNSKEDLQSIQENGKTEFNINDNYILSYSTDDFIDEMFNEINGLEYYLYDVDSTGLLIFEALDMFTFRHNGIDYKTIMFNDDIKLTQGLVETTFVEKPEETKSDYITTDKEKNKLNNAIIGLDKANAEIVLKVDSNGRIAQARLDGNADDGTLFEVKADNIKLEGYTTINKGFSVDIDGNATMKNGKFNGGTIEIDDLGKNSAYSLLMYDSNNSSTIERNIRIDDVLSGKTIKTNFPERPSSVMYAALTPIDLITTTYGKIIYNKSTATGVMEEIYVTKNNDDSYKETIYYQENYLVAINKKNFILPKDFGTVTAIKSSIPYSLITTDFLNTEQYLGINSGTIMIKDENNSIDTNYSSNGMIIKNSTGRVIVEPNLIEIDMKGRIMYMSTDDAFYEGDGENAPLFQLNSAFSVYSTGKFTNNSGFDVDRYGNVTCFSLTQTSLEENKKNFEIYNDALKEIKNIDIYKYNLKDEKAGSKKHLGFVIGDNFNYSKLVTSIDNRGVDNYSFTSLCLQAIKEQQEQIEALQNQINELKEMINNGKYKD